MNDSERAARGHNAQRALDEFLEPAFAVAIAAYMARLTEIAAKEPWSAPKITALANATRIAEEVKRQIQSIVIDGEKARSDIERAKRVEELSPARKRLLNIGAY